MNNRDIVPSLVSIIIPTYNRKHYLPLAIKSALAQTYSNFEVIVSDDCSNESIDDIASDFSDSRVRFRRNSSNLYQAGNFLAALDECQGEFIATLHDDDLWSPDFLMCLVPKLIQHSHVNVAFSNHEIIDANGIVIPGRADIVEKRHHRSNLTAGLHCPFIEEAVIHNAVPVAMASVFRFSSLNEQVHTLLPQYKYHYDWVLSYLLCRKGEPVWFDPRRLTYYRSHNQSINLASANLKEKDEGGIGVCKLMMDDPCLISIHEQIQSLLGKLQTRAGIKLIQTGQRDEGFHLLLEGWKNSKDIRAVCTALIALLPENLAKSLITELKRIKRRLGICA